MSKPKNKSNDRYILKASTQRLFSRNVTTSF